MDRRSITWKDLTLALLTLIIVPTAGFLFKDVYGSVQALKKDKVDRAEFYHVVDSADKKSDLIIKLLQDHEANSRRGRR